MPLKTLKVRVKDRHYAELRRMASSVNMVWNYCNELAARQLAERHTWMSGFELCKYTNGSSKELGISAQSIVIVCCEYATRRRKLSRRKLSWRKSTGTRRSLGWIPTNPQTTRWKCGAVNHNGTDFKVFDSYGLGNYKFRAGSFNEDARGRWYFNVAVEFETKPSTGTSATGIDLGCKDAVVTSDGHVLKGRWYREAEAGIAKAQRARKKKLARARHAKAANRRKDALHKLSRKLVDTNAAIFVGNVSSSKMAKTRMAKSASDAGWAMFKTMLEYKCDHAGIVFGLVNEANSSRRCSCCGSIPDSSPKGMGGLGIREWTCSDCGASHDRDVNAAKNILRLGLETLTEGAFAEAHRSSQGDLL